MPDSEVEWVDAEYDSIRGLIKSSWTMTSDTFSLNVTIPINTHATIDLTFIPNGMTYEVGSGDYSFVLSLIK